MAPRFTQLRPSALPVPSRFSVLPRRHGVCGLVSVWRASKRLLRRLNNERNAAVPQRTGAASMFGNSAQSYRWLKRARVIGEVGKFMRLFNERRSQ